VNSKTGVAQTAPIPLADKDRFKVGDLEFLVQLLPGAKCAFCGVAIPEAEETSSSREDGSFLCSGCRAKADSEKASSVSPAARTAKIVLCPICGGKAEECASSSPDGRALCHRCRDSVDSSRTRILPAASLESKESSLLGIEGFQVIKQIGRGGMGAVYLAKDLKTKEQVALKIMLPVVAVDEKAREEFLREARNSIGLKHPNIVEARRAGFSEGALFIALEYCPEGTLKDLLEKRGAPLALREALPLCLQMLDALDYAHNATLAEVRLPDGRVGSAKGLVHRDVKPENVFLSGSGPGRVAKIADFGLAKCFDMAGLSGCTMTGDFSGTLGFIPKQQFFNYKYVRPEVDVWAAAATFFWMLTLRTPREFSGDPFTCISKGAPRPLASLLPDVPEAFAKLMDSALDDRASLRFKSASSFKTSLLESLGT
jgi:serine/threonine protein kinase